MYKLDLLVACFEEIAIFVSTIVVSIGESFPAKKREVHEEHPKSAKLLAGIVVWFDQLLVDGS